MKTILFLLACTAAATQVVFASQKKPSQELKNGILLYDLKQYAKALPLFKAAAKAGDSEAIRRIGVMYASGLGGLPKDDKLALANYRKAAAAGNPRGVRDVAIAYFYGRGVPKDEKQAVALYRKGADLNDSGSMASLAWLYEYGRGGLLKDTK